MVLMGFSILCIVLTVKLVQKLYHILEEENW